MKNCPSLFARLGGSRRVAGFYFRGGWESKFQRQFGLKLRKNQTTTLKREKDTTREVGRNAMFGWGKGVQSEKGRQPECHNRKERSARNRTKEIGKKNKKDKANRGKALRKVEESRGKRETSSQIASALHQRRGRINASERDSGTKLGGKRETSGKVKTRNRSQEGGKPHSSKKRSRPKQVGKGWRKTVKTSPKTCNSAMQSGKSGCGRRFAAEPPGKSRGKGRGKKKLKGDGGTKKKLKEKKGGEKRRRFAINRKIQKKALGPR